jgi:3'-phosphoadenosine 5'-phosphosulfate sulfotransferase (PAPS reductase)/FAD synthetase
MKYIASLSFGKDSLAMLIKIKELGLPLDEVIYCDIRFDENLSGEMPLMAEFIPKAEKILKDKFNIEVKHLKGVTFKEQFYKIKKRGKHIGDNYGFPYTIGAWCNDRLKIQPIKKYLLSIKEPVIQYVGIAYDEPERYEKLNHETHIAPLYDLKITEKEAIEICKEYDLLSPIYGSSFRGGCWFCVKQRLSQLKNLYENYPELWEKLKELEKDSFNTFRPKQTLQKIEQKFKSENEQISFMEVQMKWEK